MGFPPKRKREGGGREGQGGSNKKLPTAPRKKVFSWHKRVGESPADVHPVETWGPGACALGQTGVNGLQWRWPVAYEGPFLGFQQEEENKSTRPELSLMAVLCPLTLVILSSFPFYDASVKATSQSGSIPMVSPWPGVQPTPLSSVGCWGQTGRTLWVGWEREHVTAADAAASAFIFILLLPCLLPAPSLHLPLQLHKKISCGMKVCRRQLDLWWFCLTVFTRGVKLKWNLIEWNFNSWKGLHLNTQDSQNLLVFFPGNFQRITLREMSTKGLLEIGCMDLPELL